MKTKIFLLITLFSVITYSQTSFREGYFITNEGNRIDCLIKNIDWKNNPDTFDYKLTETSNYAIKTIDDVAEFGIINYSQYKRYTVDIDRSSNSYNLDHVTNVRKPIFKKETIFLQTLIKGKVSLFEYIDGSFKVFFIKEEDKMIQQLIYKLYYINNAIAKNVTYKQQLLNSLKSDKITLKSVNQLKYKKIAIIKLFNNYYKYENESFESFNLSDTKDLFNLFIRPRLNSSSLSVATKDIGLIKTNRLDVKNSLNFGIGLEAEFIFPYYNNRWAFCVEPTFQYFSANEVFLNQNLDIKYTSIEIPVGIKHYLYFNNDSKVFVNGSFVLDISLNSQFDFEFANDLEIYTRNNFAFGIGYNYKNKYIGEFRIQTNREILSNYIFWDTGYNQISFIIGYNLF